MFNKIVDLLKQVFWLKPTPKRTVRKSSAKRPKKALKKPAVRVKAVKSPKSPKPVEKPVKLKPAPKEKKVKKVDVDPNLKPMGAITHYFDRIKVAVLRIDAGTVLIGDRLTIVSGKTKFVQKVWSMQMESLDVKVAKKGQMIGIKVDKPVVPGDIVYK